MRSGYHLFSVEWNQKEIVWKIDEIIYKTESLDKRFYRSENGNPFDNDFIFYIKNVGLEFREFNISEAYVLIDYFKVYEWVTDNNTNIITIANNNTITSCYSCDCGLPALPPQVVIKGSRDLTPPKKYKNGQVVNFDCASNEFGESSQLLTQLIGRKISVCTNGKWNEKSGVCGN